MISYIHCSVDNFDAVQVSTGPLSLALVPELGGKLTSLRDLRTSREWLWRNPRIPYQRVPHGDSYVLKADTGGWDECFPTVAPCAYPAPPWTGAALPDHGELWSQAAALDVGEAPDEVTLRTRWHGVALPYTFERTITLTSDSARIHFEYRVHNNSDASLQFIWSAHPLLAIEPGMQLRVPPEARFHRWSSVPADLIPQDSGLRFPLVANSVDLTTLPAPSAAIALKLWSDPLCQGWAALAARDGALHMRWDPALLPQLGFWLNLGAWAGDGGDPYYNLGLEPCIGAQDSLADAVLRYNLFETLPPRATRAWWLDLELV